MTRQEIEEIIRRNIRTNGRGEITARVMAGVLESFVTYTDSLSAEFVQLCNAIADAFTVLVTQQAEDFTAAATAMEQSFEGKASSLESEFERFCTALLNDNFKPWAETLDGHYTAAVGDAVSRSEALAGQYRQALNDATTRSETLAGQYVTLAQTLATNYAGALAEMERRSASLAAQYENTADGINEALQIIRAGNTDGTVITLPDGIKFRGSSVSAFPAGFDFSQVTDYSYMFEYCTNLEHIPAGITEIGNGPTATASESDYAFSGCEALEDLGGKKIYLGRGTFMMCSSLGYVAPGEAVANGREDAEETFVNCISLASANIVIEPYSDNRTIRFIRTFWGCYDLEQLYFSVNNPNNYDYRIVLDSPFSPGPISSITTWPSGLPMDKCSELVNAFPIRLDAVPAFDATNLEVFHQATDEIWGTPGDCGAQIGAITNLGASITNGINLAGFVLLNLTSLQNIANGLVKKTAGSNVLTLNELLSGLFNSDTTQYTFEGETYVGLAAYISAKGWTVAWANS